MVLFALRFSALISGSHDPLSNVLNWFAYLFVVINEIIYCRAGYAKSQSPISGITCPQVNLIFFSRETNEHLVLLYKNSCALSIPQEKEESKLEFIISIGSHRILCRHKVSVCRVELVFWNQLHNFEARESSRSPKGPETRRRINDPSINHHNKRNSAVRICIIISMRESHDTRLYQR